MLAHESGEMSSPKRTSGPFFLLSSRSFNGINNLGAEMRWRSSSSSSSSNSRVSKSWSISTTSWLNISLALVLCFFIILDTSTVTAYPSPVSVPSRSYRDIAHAKSIPSTTLHSLQQGVDSGSSLSIVSPLDVLRQNMVLEIMRRRVRHAKQRQLQSNKEILDRIG